MEYMKSIRKRNIQYRTIALIVVSLVSLGLLSFSPYGLLQTSAQEESEPLPDSFSYHDVEIINEESYLQNSNTIDYTIESGETLLGIFQREGGLSYGTSLALVQDISEVFSINRIRAGNTISFVFSNENIMSISYDISSNEELLVYFEGDDYTVVRQSIEYEVVEDFVAGIVEDSLYQSGLRAGLTDRMIMELATVFAWDVDFTSSLREGDQFFLVFEKRYRNGEFAGTGNLLAARFLNNGNEFFAYQVVHDDGSHKYYNENGDATEKMFLKTPLNYTRISSGFSLNRKHPILGTFQTHRAIDFAAPTGTPIETVADGTVVFAGWQGAYGNFIKIEHGGGIATAYAHLSKMNVKKGDRVRQGQVIGEVGTTGRSTGPHLHYEMYKNGELVHPLETKTPSGDPVPDSLRSTLQQNISLYRPLLTRN